MDFKVKGGRLKVEGGRRIPSTAKFVIGVFSFLLPPSTFLLISCEREIDIDYHQVEPIYVVEAYVNDEGMQARITQTNDMDDNTTESDISQATVVLTGSDGSTTRLPYTGNGYYKASATGTAGIEYRIDIDLDGHHFTSTSTMQQTPELTQFRFVWKKVLSERFLVGELSFLDIPNESNWYFFHISRNGIGYRWAVKRDDTDPNKEMQQFFNIAREGSDDKDMLHDGDNLRIEMRAIDQRSYEYLYSMQIMDNTGTNPIQNFTGGCLGYFSAYSQIMFYETFYLKDVEEEEE